MSEVGLSRPAPPPAAAARLALCGGLDRRRRRGLCGGQRARPGRRPVAVAGPCRPGRPGGCGRSRATSVVSGRSALSPGGLHSQRPRRPERCPRRYRRHPGRCAGAMGHRPRTSGGSARTDHIRCPRAGVRRIFALRQRSWRRRRRDPRSRQLWRSGRHADSAARLASMAARAMWAVVAGVEPLAFLAIVQQLTKTYGSSYGGFASVLPAGEALRSAGPLNPNPFGQVLVTSAVLAFYLALVHSRPSARALAGASAVVCATGVVYTQSRAALVTLVLAAVAVALVPGRAPARRRSHRMCGDRARRCAAAEHPAAAGRGAVRGRELLEARRLRTAHCADARARTSPACRCGPTTRSSASGLTTSRSTTGTTPQPSGLISVRSGALPTISISSRSRRRDCSEPWRSSACSWLALTGAWRARSRLEGAEALAGRGTACGARRIPHLRRHPAQRLRPLRVDLRGLRPGGKVAWRGGLRDDDGRGRDLTCPRAR